MKIKSSEINPPKDKIAVELEALKTSTQDSIDSLKDDFKENKLDYSAFSEQLIKVFNDALIKLEKLYINSQPDIESINKPLVEGITKGLETLSNQLNRTVLEFKASIKPDKSTQKAINKLEAAVRVLNKKDFKATLNSPDKIQAFITNKTPKEAVPVVLSSKDGRNFYDALASLQGMISAGAVQQSLIENNRIKTTVQGLDLSGTSIESEPIFKEDPSDTGETPKYGKVDSDGRVQTEDANITDQLTQYKINDIDKGSIHNYYGYTNKDESWYIMRETIAGDEYRYATVSNNAGKDYDTATTGAWDDRENLTYGRFHVAF